METQSNGTTGRRQWRKTLKKMQRKQRRQKTAKERDKKLEEVEAANLRDPAYRAYQQNQADLEKYQRDEEERRRQYEEEAWLRRELLVQRYQQRRAAEESKKLAEQAAIAAKQQQERDEKQRRAQEIDAEFENTMQRMQDYLTHEETEEEEEGSATAPPELRSFVDSRPGAKLCEFYARTNCCRFGAPCVFNHRRPLLARIIVVRHFFMHALLQPAEHKEYAGADAALEMNERDLRDDYYAFFEDVVPEMEGYGAVINFRTIRNVQSHLRGHVFVEFANERSALKAFIGLQGRYYATRRLNVEFSNLLMWRGAICGTCAANCCGLLKRPFFNSQGLSVTHKCPKAQNCNYLHLFSNPRNKYNILLEYTLTPTHSARKVTPINTAIATPVLSWDDVGKPNEIENSRNWRWSESPDKSVQNTTAVSSIESSSPVKQKRREASSSNREHKRAKYSHSSYSSKRNNRSRSRESDSKSNRNKSRSHSRSRSKSCERRYSKNRRSYSNTRLRSRESNSKSIRYRNRSKSRSRSKSWERRYSRKRSEKSHSNTRSRSRESNSKSIRYRNRSKSRSRSKSWEHRYSRKRSERSHSNTRSRSRESNSKSIRYRNRSKSRSRSKSCERRYSKKRRSYSNTRSRSRESNSKSIPTKTLSNSRTRSKSSDGS